MPTIHDYFFIINHIDLLAIFILPTGGHCSFAKRCFELHWLTEDVEYGIENLERG